MLWITRFILGLGGVGGDYPISATLMSEYAPARSRGGLFVAGVFSMQGWGIVTAALLGLGLLNAKVNPDLAWRVILGFGAVMPASSFTLGVKSMRHPGLSTLLRVMLRVPGGPLRTCLGRTWR